MGLDMYLMKRHKYREGDDEYNQLVDELSEEIMYWRKANQIRRWFVEHTDLNEDDNCKPIPLTKEILEQLYNDCHAVLRDHSKAEEILPCSSGFFFGSTEYDDWYFEQLRKTVDVIEGILEDTDFEEYEIDYNEWW